MNRSRTILLAAWGLLAVATLYQVVRPAASPNDEAAPAPGAGELAYRPDDEAGEDPATADTDDAEARGDAHSALDDTERDAEGADGGPRRQSPTQLDDPAHWDSAGVVLAPRAHVATVTGDGVASTTEPGAGDPTHWFPSPTQFGGERAFLVLDQETSEDYVKVSLPVMPNGQEGWIPRSAVEISTVEHRALVNLTDRTVTVWDGDEVIVDTLAVTGKPSTPTPLGVFFVRDIIAQEDGTGFYGPYILALSGFSEILDTFNGALPALAIHGTDDPYQVGTERSSGCIRIPNELISILASSVPLGTPVTIVV